MSIHGVSIHNRLLGIQKKNTLRIQQFSKYNLESSHYKYNLKYCATNDMVIMTV
jgi:hypothetical protein